MLRVMFDYLDMSYSTVLLASEGAGMGTGWGMWYVYSPGGRQYKCTGCIPGPSPKLGATCLHESTFCHCINTLWEMENIWALCCIWKQSWSCEEHVYKIKHLYRIFCLTSLVFPLQQNLHGGLRSSFQVKPTEVQAPGRRPDLGWSRTVRPPPALLSRTLINWMPLSQTQI